MGGVGWLRLFWLRRLDVRCYSGRTVRRSESAGQGGVVGVGERSVEYGQQAESS